MSQFGRISTVLWLLGLGLVALFVYHVVVGGLDPTEVAVLSVATVVFLVLFAIHEVRVYRALHDHGHPDHRLIMDGLHRHRELRGF